MFSPWCAVPQKRCFLHSGRNRRSVWESQVLSKRTKRTYIYLELLYRTWLKGPTSTLGGNKRCMGTLFGILISLHEGRAFLSFFQFRTERFVETGMKESATFLLFWLQTGATSNTAPACNSSTPKVALVFLLSLPLWLRASNQKKLTPQGGTLLPPRLQWSLCHLQGRAPVTPLLLDCSPTAFTLHTGMFCQLPHLRCLLESLARIPSLFSSQGCSSNSLTPPMTVLHLLSSQGYSDSSLVWGAHLNPWLLYSPRILSHLRCLLESLNGVPTLFAPLASMLH